MKRGPWAYISRGWPGYVLSALTPNRRNVVVPTHLSSCRILPCLALSRLLLCLLWMRSYLEVNHHLYLDIHFYCCTASIIRSIPTHTPVLYLPFDPLRPSGPRTYYRLSYQAIAPSNNSRDTLFLSKELVNK